MGGLSERDGGGGGGGVEHRAKNEISHLSCGHEI